MSLHYIVLGFWLVASFLILPASVSAQAAAARDTQRTSDSLAPGSQPHSDSLAALDTNRSGSSSDSLNPGSDSLKPPAATQAESAGSAPDSARVSAAEADSILVAACGRLQGGASVAPDLLVLLFAPEAKREERAAVARSVNGKLLGAVSSEPGAYYLRVPTRGEEYKLRAVADELIRSPWVRQVGSRTCPAAQPLSVHQRADTLSSSGK